jgi:hypothetical protein
MTRACVAASIVLPAVALATARTSAQGTGPMDTIARGYITVMLAMGQHDSDFVDAYYGPPEWKKEADAEKMPLERIDAAATALRTRVNELPVGQSEIERLRREYLDRQLSALLARIRIVQGERLRFDEESKALYDAVAPTHPESYFDEILKKLEARFPGNGTLAARYDAWRKPFIVPKDKLDAVFQTAIRACRERTAEHLQLPAGESFTVEYVTDKSWSGYNWYQGNYRSLIQVNTDLPVYIDRAVDLACHEGYPGHHVYNVLLEKHLVRDRGWLEFSVYPLFSPQSLIAEGTANYGIEVAFPGASRLEYEQKMLFPAAGIDPARAKEYYEVQALVDRLSYAGNEAARRYLDGHIDAEAAANWLVRYTLSSPERARQRVKFFDQYRSYVINYNLGKDLVRHHIESRGGTASNPAKRWQEFGALLSSPRLPSGLQR